MPFNPILNIGLGTTGGEIVTQIARTVQREGDEWCKNHIRNAIFLSESDTPDKIDDSLVPDIYHLSEGDAATQEYVDAFLNADNQISAQFKQWYPIESSGMPHYPPSANFAEGCAGFRPAGRLLLHRMRGGNDSLATSLQSIFQQIQQRAEQWNRFVQGQQQNENEQEEGNAPPDAAQNACVCNVFANLAGGTASGLYLDFALLLRKAANMAGTQGLWIFGHFLTGDTCYLPILPSHRSNTKVGLQRCNTIRALCELAVVQSADGWNAARPNWPKTVGADQIADAPSFIQPNIFPYDVAFLIGGSRENERSPALDHPENYFSLLADSVSQRLTSSLDAERVGSWTDTINGHRTRHSSKSKNRPCQIGSIGYLHLRLPKKKIAAVAMYQIADEILNTRMKSLDEVLKNEVMTEVRNSLALDNVLLKWFSPPEETFSGNTGDDPVAEDREAFKTAWINALANMRDHYAKWDAAEDGAKAHIQQFQQNAETAIRLVIQKALLDPERFSFGTFKVLVEELSREVKSLVTFFSEREAEFNKVLLADKGFEKNFESVVDDLAKQYPKKPIFGLGDGRRHFHGHRTAGDFFASTREALRLRSKIKAARPALNKLQEDLKHLETLRGLIGKRASYRGLDNAKSLVNTEFGNKVQTNNGCQFEVISTRDEVTRFAQKTILRSREVIDQGAKAYQAAFARVLATPIGGSTDGLAELLFRKFKSASTYTVQTHDAAWDDPGIKDLVLVVQHALDEVFAHQEALLEARISKLTVWDAILANIDEEGDQAERQLKKFFERFRSKGKVFWNSDQIQQDMTMKESQVLVFCDEQAIKERFRQIGIRTPDFLEQLLRVAFLKPPLISPKPGYGEVLSYIQSWGIEIRNPEFPEVAAILSGEAPDEAEHWSDSRFPDWIKTLT